MPAYHTHCLLCESDKLVELNRFKDKHLVRCNACHFVFSKKIPGAAELAAHYDAYPRGTNISSITVKRYRELLEKFAQVKKTGNILDIGCGDGHFLEVAKEQGWNVFGTEYTGEAIQVCSSKGITMRKGKLNAGDFDGIQFDIITSFEVIEHINNPQEEIAHITKLLRTGGWFYFTTPNFNSLSRYLLGNNWNVIDYPEHLSYYTKKTVRNLLVQHNLQPVFLRTSGFDIDRFRKGISTNEKKDSRNSTETMREKAEKKTGYKLLKYALNFFLNASGTGDSLKGLFQKEN